MATLIFKSWTAGGTHITDIEPQLMDICREAVKRYGDINLIVSDTPAFGGKGGSLHDVTGMGLRNLSTFWKIYRDLESQNWKKIVDPVEDYDRAMKGIG